MSNESRIPVIVGVGEITDKPANPAQGLEPLALMAEALKRAEQDAGARLVAEIELDRSRQPGELALRGSGAAAVRTARHRAEARRVRPGRRRRPDPLPA